jgi:hypothetical protein
MRNIHDVIDRIQSHLIMPSDVRLNADLSSIVISSQIGKRHFTVIEPLTPNKFIHPEWANILVKRCISAVNKRLLTLI